MSAPEDVIVWALDQRTFKSSTNQERAAAIMREFHFNWMTVVVLPKPMEDRSGVADVLRSLPMWAVGDSWTCLREPDLVEFEADSRQVYGEFSVRDARELAAALLAAANAAEASK